jgi:hypothetical protein
MHGSTNIKKTCYTYSVHQASYKGGGKSHWNASKFICAKSQMNFHGQTWITANIQPQITEKLWWTVCEHSCEVHIFTSPVSFVSNSFLCPFFNLLAPITHVHTQVIDTVVCQWCINVFSKYLATTTRITVSTKLHGTNTITSITCSCNFSLGTHFYIFYTTIITTSLTIFIQPLDPNVATGSQFQLWKPLCAPVQDTTVPFSYEQLPRSAHKV